jgi:glycosyltransferase involved in cell wall biosynthesis
MMVTAPVSAVIPARNAARFIKDAIESVRRQTLAVSELIVVADDCSDATAKIAKERGARVLEIKARNPSAGRNAGIRAASHDWIAFLDADDVWEANKIERQWKARVAFPDAAIIACDLCIVSDQGITKVSKKDIRERHAKLTCEAIFARAGTYFAEVDGSVLTAFPLFPPSVMLRRDVVELSGSWDESIRYGEGVEFFARALKDHSLIFVEEPLVCRRLRPDSLTSNVQQAWSSHISMVDKMLRCPGKYAPRAGLAHRELLKQMFVMYERALVKRDQGLGPSEHSARTSAPGIKRKAP